MFAEAENELNGPTTQAYNALNMVRRRGFGKPIGTADAVVDLPSGLSKADFFKAVVRERSLELGGEGVRKFDLIRWNLLGKALSETRDNLVRMSTNAPVVPVSYMLPPPDYTITSSLPNAMYFIKTATADDYRIWANSYYKPAPTSTPANTTKVNWVQSAINTTSVSRYATGFTPGKSELLPIPQPARDANFNLTQNPGY
jgi:hypothetical protein